MHNLDRVLSQQEVFGDNEYLGNEFEAFADEYSDEFETDGESDGEFDEAELAAELLTVSSEAELDQFFGKLFKTVSKGVSTLAKSPVGKIVGGALKQAAKSALPSVGAALGSMIPIPGVGTALGGMAGKALASALEMETAGLSAEDSEFEMAKGIVRMAANAAQTAARAPAGSNPTAVANTAIRGAIRSVATQGGGAARAAGGTARATQGRWIRRGRQIILLGV